MDLVAFADALDQLDIPELCSLSEQCEEVRHGLARLSEIADSFDNEALREKDNYGVAIAYRESIRQFVGFFGYEDALSGRWKL